MCQLSAHMHSAKTGKWALLSVRGACSAQCQATSNHRPGSFHPILRHLPKALPPSLAAGHGQNRTRE